MKIIGVSGLARSGKDTFFEMSVRMKSEYGKNIRRYAFADELKKECDHYLISEYGISAFSNDTDEKKIIRPYLVLYGTEKRNEDMNYWVNKVQEKIEKDKTSKAIFITDVRYENEINWIKSLNGINIHVERVGNKPPNEEEKKNDPLLKKMCNFRLRWNDFNKPTNKEDITIPFGAKKIINSIL